MSGHALRFEHCTISFDAAAKAAIAKGHLSSIATACWFYLLCRAAHTCPSSDASQQKATLGSKLAQVKSQSAETIGPRPKRRVSRARRAMAADIQ
jgi:hypothetical protein